MCRLMGPKFRKNCRPILYLSQPLPAQILHLRKYRVLCHNLTQAAQIT